MLFRIPHRRLSLQGNPRMVVEVAKYIRDDGGRGDRGGSVAGRSNSISGAMNSSSFYRGQRTQSFTETSPVSGLAQALAEADLDGPAPASITLSPGATTGGMPGTTNTPPVRSPSTYSGSGRSVSVAAGGAAPAPTGGGFNLALDEMVFLRSIIPHCAEAMAQQHAPRMVQVQQPEVNSSEAAAASQSAKEVRRSDSNTSAKGVMLPSRSSSSKGPVAAAASTSASESSRHSGKATTILLQKPLAATVVSKADQSLTLNECRSAGDWSSWVWNQQLQQARGSAAGSASTTIQWDDHLSALLRAHSRRVFTFVNKHLRVSDVSSGDESLRSCTGEGSATTGMEQRELSIEQLQFFRSNAKMWGKAAGAVTSGGDIPRAAFSQWFAWFHETLLNVALAVGSVTLQGNKSCSLPSDADLIRFCNHGHATKTLLKSMPTGTFVVCCSESKAALVVVHVARSSSSSSGLKVSSPVMLTLDVHRPKQQEGETDALVVGVGELEVYDDAHADVPAACVHCPVSFQYPVSASAGGTQLRAHGTFQELLRHVGAITHLYPCIPKDSFVHHDER